MFRVSRCRSVLPPTWQGQIVLLAVHRLLVGICEINNSIIIPIVGNVLLHEYSNTRIFTRTTDNTLSRAGS